VGVTAGSREEKARDNRHPYRIIIVRLTTSTNERKIGTGIQQEIKNDTEI